MMPDGATLSIAAGVATLTLDNGPGNRIDFAMRRAIRDAIARIAESDARVLLVRGNGVDFCRGGDVREWIDVPRRELEPKIAVFADALAALRALPIPTLTVVQGGCMGGGFELALSCDFILAAHDARFRFPEINSGILTLQGGAMLLAERIGRAKALELIMLACEVTAETLASWNVVNRVVDRFRLDREATAIAAALSEISADVVRATKRLLATWENDGADAAIRDWYTVSMPLFDGAETKRRLHATVQSLSVAVARSD